jgi:hypothetical protein
MQTVWLEPIALEF